MAYGKGSVTDNSLNRHKEMAGAGRKDSFGTGKYPPAARERRGSNKSESFGVESYPPGGNGSRAKGDGYRREGKA